MHRLRHFYTLGFGKYNCIPMKFDTPVEMFGQSDMHPMFYLLCNGDPNNYRLFRYGDSKGKLRKLATLTKKLSSNVENVFFAPQFVYNRSSKKLQNVRRELKKTD